MAKRLRLAAQPYPSAKAPVDHPGDAAPAAPGWTNKVRRPASERQAGTLWQRKMRTLAVRRSRDETRRHASGAPIKRGAPKRGR